VAEFILDPAFEPSSTLIGDLALCQVRLQLDARYPWLVLIPRVARAVELAHLTPPERAMLMEEIIRAGAAVRAVGGALDLPVDKLNVGALGNVTPQLHVHVVGRGRGDPAWPGPVWGHSPAEPYAADLLEQTLAAARQDLGL